MIPLAVGVGTFVGIIVIKPLLLKSTIKDASKEALITALLVGFGTAALRAIF